MMRVEERRWHITLLLAVWTLIGHLPLTVSGAIQFVAEPRSTAVLLGDDLLLDCSARDVPDNAALTTQWKFNGQSTEYSLNRANFFPNNSLFISRMREDEYGKYQCIVGTAEAPRVTKESKIVTVVEPFLADFLVHPQPQNVVEKNVATFECVSGRSAPPPVIHWYRDKVKFSGGKQTFATFGEEGPGGSFAGTAKLELTAMKSMEAMYSCEAVNPLSNRTKVSNAVSLTVVLLTKKPHIERPPPASVMPPANAPFTLDCGIVGEPKPVITWYRNNVRLQNTSLIRILPNGSLYFPELLRQQMGSYKCQGTNNLGGVTTSPTTLAVAYLSIDFTVQPTDVATTAGRPATIRCSPPSSLPPANISWFKDNKPFQTRSGVYLATVINTGDLFFSSVQLGDVGEYFCIATNNFAIPSSRTSNRAVLSVKARPIFTEPPIPTKVVKGRLLFLKCKVNGDPFPMIRWFRGQDEITTSDFRVSFRDSKQELLINPVHKTDEGTYKCTASNQYGTSESSQVFISVVVPPEIIIPVKDQVVTQGSKVMLTCDATGDPKPNVTWFQNGRRVVYSSGKRALSDGLEILAVQVTDQGNYTCRATNDGGVKESRGSIIVQVPPTFVKSPSDMAVNLSQSVTIHCQASGVPAPSLSWKFNGSSVLPGGLMFSTDRTQLTISSVQVGHTGTYTCIATNSVGQVSASGLLYIQVAPRITQVSGQKVIGRLSDLELTCHVTGRPRPEVNWFYKGQKLTVPFNSRIVFPAWNSLRVKYVTVNDNGAYKCVANNSAGVTQLTTNVFVRERPRPPVLRDPFAVSTQSINISWTPQRQDQNNSVTYWKIQYKETFASAYRLYPADVPGHMTSHEVDSLRPATAYLFRVAAGNEIGTGEYSGAKSASTFETAPSEPRNLKVLFTNSTTAQLQWEVPANRNGQIRNYQVHYRRLGKENSFTVKEIVLPTIPLQQYTVTGLHPNSSYQFKTRGANIEKDTKLWGNFSAIVQARTDIAAPSGSPPGFTVSALNQTAIRLYWRPLPEEQQNGPIRGYTIMYRLTNRAPVSPDVRVSAGQLSSVIGGLLPWRTYEFRIQAYNLAGPGPWTQYSSSKTLPGTPTGTPRDVSVSTLSSTAIRVTWKGLSPDKMNSDISGYTVNYARVGDSQGVKQFIGSASTTTQDISGLEPYTVYNVRVRAFTNQLPAGFGPYSDVVRITTKEDIPGPVSGVSAVAYPYAIRLSWASPAKANGVIVQYIVSYFGETIVTTVQPTTEGSTDSNASVTRETGLLRSRRSTSPQLGNASHPLVAYSKTTSIMLDDLAPLTRYSFTVLPETSAGKGTQVVNYAMSTLGPTPAPPEPSTTGAPFIETNTTTPVPINTVPPVVPTSGPLIAQKDIPVVVGVCLTLFFLLLLLLGVLIYWCCRRRQEKEREGIYYIPPRTTGERETRNIMELNRPDRSNMIDLKMETESADSEYNPNPYSLHMDNTFQKPQNNYSPEENNYMRTVIARSQSDNVRNRPANVSPSRRHRDLDPTYDLTYSSLDELHLPRIPENRLMRLDTVYSDASVVGIENEAFDESLNDLDQASTSANVSYGNVPPPLPHRTSGDIYARVIPRQKRNRMKSNTAAAIAVQKNRNTSVLINDTDSLINNESVVVYDERTAL